MAKNAKTREELIAEANKKPAESAALGADPAESEVENEEDPPLSPEAQAEADRIINESVEAVNAEEGRSANDDGVNEAYSLLENILNGYALTAPNEFVVFGNGGGKFTLGHLRALFGRKK